MKVLLFGAIGEVIGNSFIEIERVQDTDELLQYLMNEYPVLANYSFQLVINKEQVASLVQLNGNDEIALLPPFAGG